MKTFLVLLPILLSQAVCSDYPPPRELYTLSWTGGPLVWPSNTIRFLYKTLGKFIPKNMIATRATIFRDDLFVTFSRYLSGVPVTLAKTSLLSLNHEAVFEPFPSWEAQTEGDPDALQNAVDLFRDRKDVLWVLDTGITQTLENSTVQCGPRVFGFDLISGKRKFKVDLSPISSPSSRLQYIVVDFDSKDRRFIYVSDASGAILVYNLDKDISFRANLPKIIRDDCTTPDVLYLSLVKNESGRKLIYLSYLSGQHVFAISPEKLQAGTTGSVDRISGQKWQKLIVIGCENSLIYFRYEGKGDVFSWNVNTELTQENLKLVHEGGSGLLATHVVLDPIRSRMRVLLSNFLDFLRRSVGVGAVQVLTAL